MKLVSATVKALETADGLAGLQEDISWVGMTMYVDMHRIIDMVWGNAGSPVETTRRSIYVDGAENGTGPGWMPVELLNLPLPSTSTGNFPPNAPELSGSAGAA